jgi:hypothetical protein
MKRGNIIPLTVVFFICYTVTNAQSSCKVLKPEIAGSYTGSCKQGFADGEGEAKGEDYYKGNFAKGLPEGKGTYIWKNGAVYKGEWRKGMRNGNGTYTSKGESKDTVLSGKWRNDIFIGNPNSSQQYLVEYRNGVGRVSFIKVGERPYIKYVFSRNGGENNNISNLLMQGSSGQEKTQTSFTGFEQVTFPFRGKVNFSAPNAFNTAILTCELRFVVNEPGSWLVTISY